MKIYHPGDYSTDKLKTVLEFCPEQLQSMVANKGSDLLLNKWKNNAYIVEVTSDTGDVIGVSVFYCNNTVSKEAFITLIAIDPDARRCGIGSKLLTYTHKYCNELGFKKILLDTYSYRLIEWYKKFGYKEMKTINDNDDVFRMKLVLI